jgi:hypothetical protein
VGRDFQRVLRFGGKQDQVKLVSLSVVLNCGNVDSVCPHSPPMPDTRRPDLRNAFAESVLRAASRTGSPVRMARAAIVPPNAPMPTISICILKPPRWQSCPVYDRMTIENDNQFLLLGRLFGKVFAGKVTCGVRSETSGLSAVISRSKSPL